MSAITFYTNGYSTQPITHRDLQPYLSRKFPEKYRLLQEKYGAMEVIWNKVDVSSCHCGCHVDFMLRDVAVDLQPPHDYLEETDKNERARIEGRLGRDSAGGYRAFFSYHGPLSGVPIRPVTSALLRSLAEAERNFYKTELDLFHTEPGYLYRRIYTDGLTRHEIMPDLNGNAPQLEDLFLNPRFVCQIARFAIHNTVIRAGMWDTVAKYMQEVEKLDAEKGRMGALDKRDELILAVKKIVEASTRNVEDRESDHRLRFGKQVLETHQDFMGTDIQLVDDPRVMDKLDHSRDEG
ncbi:hypothetical protein VKT23_018492 [Stygiomarasmius scandens]|uniref:Uncharacterized protein n=1 Tax=Marasmiellus scandens TaxID=2682957 RepID=A0ABR1ITF2_9AGAR